MKNLAKVLSVVLALVMVVACFAACGSKTVEMVVDLTPEAVTEAARHIDELSYGATKFTLCLSATAAQEVGAVTLALLREQGAVVRVAPGLASCLDGAGRLMQDGVVALSCSSTGFS